MNGQSPGKWNFSFYRFRFIVRLVSRAHVCVHTFSEPSICDVSEQLKQDGGSSRGSGDRVRIVVPTGTSSEKSLILNKLCWCL